MAKNTDPKQTAAQAAPAPSGKKSALPIIAAVLFLLAAAFNAYLPVLLYGGTLSRPSLGTLLTAFLIVALFLRREQDLVPLALGLRCLNTLVPWARAIVTGGFFAAIHYSNLATLILAVLTVLLALPNMRDKMRKVWWLPATLGAAIITIGTCMDAVAYDNPGSPYVIARCLEVYAYLFLCAWLAYPNMTFKGMVASSQREDTVAALMLKWLVQGAGLGIALLIIMCGMSLFNNGNLDVILNQAYLVTLLLFGSPVISWVTQFISAMRRGAKETKRMKHDMNVIKSSMGGVIGAQAKAELRKEAGKAAANAVIKGALIGDLIGGDTGAVVGAMAAKAKIDQTTGGGSVDGVAGDAVTGGLITGSSSAVVGGLAAQAQKDAENSIK